MLLHTTLPAFATLAQEFGSDRFSTAEFIEVLSQDAPQLWLEIVERYGFGGSGAGRHYTAYSYTAHKLAQLARQGTMVRHDYDDSPPGWGSPVIRFWSVTKPKGTRTRTKATGLPSWTDTEFREGDMVLKVHLQRERHPGVPRAKRDQFRRDHGRLFCETCDFDPKGDPILEAAIEVHHATTAIGDMAGGHLVTLDDLQCLCATCHRIVHARLRAEAAPAKG